MPNDEIRVESEEVKLETKPVDETTEPKKEEAKSIVETIIQNGVSKEELRQMLDEILNKPAPISNADIAKAEHDYLIGHIQY